MHSVIVGGQLAQGTEQGYRKEYLWSLEVSVLSISTQCVAQQGSNQ